MPDPPRWRFSPERMAIDQRFGFQREFASEARRLLGVRPGDRVLDVGCGTGALTDFLLPSLEGRGEIVAVDHDEQLVEEARRRFPGSDVPVRFERADAMKLPFPDASFDFVASQFLLCILPEPLVALREMARVARPGATVASFSCFCKSGALPAFHGLLEFAGRERFLDLEPRFRRTYRTTVRNPGIGLPNGRDLDVWGDYARAGLVDLRITGFMAVYAPADARWSREDALEYVERRERVDLGLLDNLSEAQLDTLEARGFRRTEVRELRALFVERYAAMRADASALRRGMDAVADPTVLITGRVPAG